MNNSLSRSLIVILKMRRTSRIRRRTLRMMMNLRLSSTLEGEIRPNKSKSIKRKKVTRRKYLLKAQSFQRLEKGLSLKIP
jgi:hypothetical protein